MNKTRQNAPAHCAFCGTHGTYKQLKAHIFTCEHHPLWLVQVELNKSLASPLLVANALNLIERLKGEATS